MRRALLLSCLVLAGCGEPVTSGNGADNQTRPADIVTSEPVPVRIGELGPNIAACSTAGTTRHLEAAESLPVRSAPFDNAESTGAVKAGGRFFVCTRSLDQKWLGIVYDPDFTLNMRCGVSDPVPARRTYEGQCRSGWVSTPFVKLIAGDDEPAAGASRGAVEENSAGFEAAQKSQ